ncbi:hypothetical protein B9Z19DRAFT_1125148 [Tuber borchii]|uniref:Uncharacterized protein n=1 Tax=Tuber borchii TaxID=42251 RepID=A0A2T6ZVG3_TUBBO|nr:hypothetical protein B9Z19DRAFT_1125148 [Tuber borchii]
MPIAGGRRSDHNRQETLAYPQMVSIRHPKSTELYRDITEKVRSIKMRLVEKEILSGEYAPPQNPQASRRRSGPLNVFMASKNVIFCNTPIDLCGRSNFALTGLGDSRYTSQARITLQISQAVPSLVDRHSTLSYLTWILDSRRMGFSAAGDAIVESARWTPSTTSIFSGLADIKAELTQHL